MKVTVDTKRSGTIFNLDSRRDLQLVTDSQDTEAVKEYFGNDPNVQDFDGFFVKVEDGDYTEVYGFYGGVPRSYLDVFKITRTFSESTSKRKPTKKSKPRAKKRSGDSPTSLRGMRR